MLNFLRVSYTCACSEMCLFGNAHLLHQHAACHCDSCDGKPLKLLSHFAKLLCRTRWIIELNWASDLKAKAQKPGGDHVHKRGRENSWWEHWWRDGLALWRWEINAMMIQLYNCLKRSRKTNQASSWNEWAPDQLPKPKAHVSKQGSDLISLLHQRPLFIQLHAFHNIYFQINPYREHVVWIHLHQRLFVDFDCFHCTHL